MTGQGLQEQIINILDTTQITSLKLCCRQKCVKIRYINSYMFVFVVLTDIVISTIGFPEFVFPLEYILVQIFNFIIMITIFLLYYK
jgi:hypothetical protein